MEYLKWLMDTVSSRPGVKEIPFWCHQALCNFVAQHPFGHLKHSSSPPSDQQNSLCWPWGRFCSHQDSSSLFFSCCGSSCQVSTLILELEALSSNHFISFAVQLLSLSWWAAQPGLLCLHMASVRVVSTQRIHLGAARTDSPIWENTPVQGMCARAALGYVADI